jgi:hypothetical protein
MEIAACSMWQHVDLQFDLYFGERLAAGPCPDGRARDFSKIWGRSWSPVLVSIAGLAAPIY